MSNNILNFAGLCDSIEEHIELLKRNYRLDSESLNLSEHEKKVLDDYAENHVKPEDEDTLDSILDRMYSVKVFDPEDPESEEY